MLGLQLNPASVFRDFTTNSLWNGRAVLLLSGKSGWLGKSQPDDPRLDTLAPGTTGLKKLRYVTLPMIYNVLVTCLILSITGVLKVFDLPWTMFPSGI